MGRLKNRQNITGIKHLYNEATYGASWNEWNNISAGA